ncbi:MAG: lysylphosphatidylglycerol synthase transmembrane domain-containing protein [Acidimicrobiales bacterium]
MAEPPGDDTRPAAGEDGPKPAEPTSWNTKTILRIGLRIVVVVVILAIALFALVNIFDDLDFNQVRAALGRLSDAEWLALGFGWLIWIGAQGLQTASLVHHLPARRGVLAFLGPSAVASVVPGPSDLPVRFSMYQSWGVGNSEAATAVAASGVFSVGSQLILPALAGLAIAFGDVEVEGFMAIIIVATLVLAAVIVGAVFVLGSAGRTERVASWLEPVWRAGNRLIRRPVPEKGSFAALVVEQRAQSFDYLSDKWLGTTGATILTIAAKCSLLIMCLRFVGIPEDILGWVAIFAVFSLVAGLTVIPITPGSAGVAEVALVGMLTPIAGSEFVNEVAAGVLLYRLLTWILVIPTGLGALGIWKLSLRGQVDGSADDEPVEAGLTPD